MKRLLVATAGSLVIYWSLLSVARLTGSGILSSGPLDWLFDVLVVPGLYLTEEVFGIHHREWLTLTICWLVYAPLMGVLVDLALRLFRRKEPEPTALS